MSDFVISKGTSKTMQRTLTDTKGNPISLTGYTSVSLYVSTALETATTQLTFSKSMTVVSAPSGIVNYAFVPADTSALAAREYLYEIEVVIPAGTYKTSPPAVFRVIPTVEV